MAIRADDKMLGSRDGADVDLRNRLDGTQLTRPSSSALRVKRAIDLVLGTLAALVFLLPAVVIAIGIRLTSKGPALFVQERVGVDGQLFRVLKFRTMRNGTDREVATDEAVRQAYEANNFKLRPDDPRITRLGRLLRASSLDELPQLVNVIRGEMSLVGVRPMLVDELARRSSYEQLCYRSMRPGMTGLWQVNGRSSIDLVDRRSLDVAYVENWSLRSDVKLLLATPLAVLRFSHAH